MAHDSSLHGMLVAWLAASQRAMALPWQYRDGSSSAALLSKCLAAIRRCCCLFLAYLSDGMAYLRGCGRCGKTSIKLFDGHFSSDRKRSDTYLNRKAVEPCRSDPICCAWLWLFSSCRPRSERIACELGWRSRVERLEREHIPHNLRNGYAADPSRNEFSASASSAFLKIVASMPPI